MRNTNINKLKKLGFIFWKPMPNKLKKTEETENKILINGNILVVVYLANNCFKRFADYRDFFLSLSKALDIEKGFFSEINNLKEEKIKLILSFGGTKKGLGKCSRMKDIPYLDFDSLEEINSSKESKIKFWTLIREFSSNNRFIIK